MTRLTRRGQNVVAWALVAFLIGLMLLGGWLTGGV